MGHEINGAIPAAPDALPIARARATPTDLLFKRLARAGDKESFLPERVQLFFFPEFFVNSIR